MTSHVDTVFYPPRFMCQIPKIQKILAFFQRVGETPILMWRNLFEHWRTRSANSSQIDQNALGQPWVDRKSKLVKIILKQHFSCFYIKPELLSDFRQLWLSLTRGWVLRAPKILILFRPSEWVETNITAKIIEFLF